MNERERERGRDWTPAAGLPLSLQKTPVSSVIIAFHTANLLLLSPS